MNTHLKTAYMFGYDSAIKTAGIGNLWNRASEWWAKRMGRVGKTVEEAAAPVAEEAAAKVRTPTMEKTIASAQEQYNHLRNSWRATPEGQARQAAIHGPETTEKWFASATPEQQQAYVDAVKKIQSAGRSWDSNPVLWAVAPGLLGGGIGSVANGKRGAAQGAALGAGVGLGARFGARGLINRLTELKGAQRLSKDVPIWEYLSPAGYNAGAQNILQSPLGRRSILMGGGAALAGGAGGVFIGGKFHPKEKQPWYSRGMGLTDIEQLPGRVGNASNLIDTVLSNLLQQRSNINAAPNSVNAAAPVIANTYY
jgi:hypothetical protein